MLLQDIVGPPTASYDKHILSLPSSLASLVLSVAGSFMHEPT